MAKVLHLGVKGEDAARHLLDAYELTPGFEPCIVISPYPAALAELRRRLAETASRLEVVRPGRTLAARVKALAQELEDDAPRPVLWLELEEFEAKPWRYALSSLNQRREFYREVAPWFWVLAGPTELVRLIHEHAMHVLTGVSIRINLDEEPRPAPIEMPKEPLRWLHLSDFHFKGLERWNRRKTLKALLRHAKELKKQDLAPRFVFITGDVAYSGKRKEYEQAELFFTELADVLELEPREDFFLVPGNHDVDQKAIGPMDNAILGALQDQEAIERVLDDAPTMGLLARRLEEFYAFTERFLGTARGWRSDRPWRVDVRKMGGINVGILQLNSAWASGQAGEQGLLVGGAQVEHALEESADAFLRIALVHHPLADLADVDRAVLETRLGAPDGVHFLLRGHLHRGRTFQHISPDGFLVELASGAAYTDGDYPRSHLLTEVDFAGGEARVRFYRYSGEGRGFWAPDTQAYEKAKDGVWRFELPPHLRIEAAAEVAAAPLSDARRATVAARYRSAAAAVHGTVRFVGLADSRPRRNVGVPELFVPLSLAPEGVEKEKPWPTAWLLKILVVKRMGGTAARVAVLGDPGSGKTTLCRFAAVVLAGEFELEDVEVAGEPLPLLLPFREYVRACRESGDRSILGFLLEQARDHLQVPIPEAFLEQALRDGEAVLLLDGLDEVGSAAERETMRERVVAFCELYPRVPVLITSRVAGYRDAPLPETWVGGFIHLELKPFDDEALRRFVTNWYEVQEPDDPVARDRGIADLTAALQADEQVRALARNPMLATLIALVHRFEAHLPGERATLYDLCVKTLLETWPAARRRRFKEIDERLQRAYLEALAYRMQLARGQGDREVTIERGKLIEALTTIVRERQGETAEAEVIQRLVERWVRYLEEGTGLLVEQRPGVFTFFHLSLMEYLAARGMERAEDLAEAVARRWHEPHWREVCLLAIGHEATDKGFLDDVYERIANQKKRRGRWSFLLRALREEAAFDDVQRIKIARGAARELLDSWPAQWWYDQQTLEAIMQLSIRHAEWAKEWVGRELARAQGEALRKIVALRGPQSREVFEALEKRSDPSVAADLLEFWPGSSIGGWAVANTDPGRALEWVLDRAPEELLAVRSLASVAAREHPLTGAHVVALAHGAALQVSQARCGIEMLAERSRLGSQGVPAAVRVEPGKSVCFGLPRWPRANLATIVAKRTYFARDSARGFASNFASDLSSYFVRYTATDFSRNFAREFVRNFARNSKGPDSNLFLKLDFSDYFSDEVYFRFFCYTVQYFANDIIRCFADEPKRGGAELISDFINSFTYDLTLAFPDEVCPMHPSDPRQASGSLFWEPPTRDREKALRAAVAWIARLAAEAWLGGVTTSEFKALEERFAYVHRRIQNAWLLTVWPAVDGRTSKDPDPASLALYFALGWTQSTTTWQWPGTEPWIARMRADPPAHWLPRSQWHLCWMLHDSEDQDHRRALQKALDEGVDDAEYPRIADELRILFPDDRPS